MTLVAVACAAACVSASAVQAETPREALVQASFGDRDKATALRRVDGVIQELADDRGADAAVLRATAFGYRAKLTGSRSDLSTSRKQYEALVTAHPGNAEAQIGLAAWHLSVIGRTGALLGRVFGANRGTGLAAIDRAVSSGGNRAFYSGLGALLRLKADPDDARGRELAEQAARASTPTQLDRILQRAANAVLTPLRAGRKAEARALAHRLLPLGSITGVN